MENDIKILNVLEKEDGGAVYELDLSEDAAKHCAQLGATLLLYCAAADISTKDGLDLIAGLIKDEN